MEWAGAVVGSVVLLAFVGSLALLVVWLLAAALLPQFLPVSPTVARTSFECPFSSERGRWVTAEFLIWPGEERPGDVQSCSAFSEPRRIRCKKACVELAQTGSISSPMVPRFSLVAGGVAYRR